MIELTCSKCGKIVRHKEADKFIYEGWKYYGDVEYCPKCSKTCSKIVTERYAMAYHLLHKLSLKIEIIEHNYRALEKKVKI